MSATSLATDGLYDGGSGTGGGTGVPPVITVISPTSGVAPGLAGGFSTDFRVASETAVVIEITAGSALGFVSVTAVNPDGSNELVYNGSNYLAPYALLSWTTTISGGIRLSTMRYGGWLPADVPTDTPYVHLLVNVSDIDANVASTDLTWQLPPSANASVASTQSIANVVDHVTESLSRLPEQFKFVNGSNV